MLVFHVRRQLAEGAVTARANPGSGALLCFCQPRCRRRDLRPRSGQLVFEAGAILFEPIPFQADRVELLLFRAGRPPVGVPVRTMLITTVVHMLVIDNFRHSEPHAASRTLGYNMPLALDVNDLGHAPKLRLPMINVNKKVAAIGKKSYIALMTLAEYLAGPPRVRQSSFARRIEHRPETLCRILAGKQTAGAKFRLAVERETMGRVHRDRDWQNGKQA